MPLCRDLRSFCVFSLGNDGLKMERKLQSFISSEVTSKERYVSMSPKQRLEHCHPPQPEKTFETLTRKKHLEGPQRFFRCGRKKYGMRKEGEKYGRQRRSTERGSHQRRDGGDGGGGRPGGGHAASLCARLSRCSETRRMAEASLRKAAFLLRRPPSLMQ